MESRPTFVAPYLRPARTFDAACALVVEYLSRSVPMGMWAVTRIVDGRQVLLAVDAPAYGLPPGTELPFAQSMCRPMAAGDTPRIAPDVTAVPEYALAAEAARPFVVNADVGTPIVRPDGALFGTVCGYDPQRQPESLHSHRPLLDLLSSRLSAVLEADTAATAVSRELELARREADTDVLTGLLNRRGWERFLYVEEQRYRRFGDEFGMLAVGAAAEQTVELVARMVKALEAAGVSGSFGHAPYSVVAGFPGAWQAADRAMYEKKRLRRARPEPV